MLPFKSIICCVLIIVKDYFVLIDFKQIKIYVSTHEHFYNCILFHLAANKRILSNFFTKENNLLYITIITYQIKIKLTRQSIWNRTVHKSSTNDVKSKIQIKSIDCHRLIDQKWTLCEMLLKKTKLTVLFDKINKQYR